MASDMPEPSTPFGERVERRLRDEMVIWLSTVGADGTPQPNPVWFLWDGETFLVYNRTEAKRLPHIRRNPRVSLNFDGDGQGGDIIVIVGEARLATQDPPADQNPAYTDKYGDFIGQRYRTPENFAAQYTVAVRIRPTKVRGH